MASQKIITDNLRNSWVQKLKDSISSLDETVLQTASGTIYIPVLDETGEERWVKISVIIPKDATEENGTDGYSLAKDYELKLEEQRAKALEAEAKKKAKIAKDKKRREEKENEKGK